jgi:hypothetical protein
MTDTDPSTSPDDLVYHLSVVPEETSVAVTALRLLISDEAHEPGIRGLAREVIAQLTSEPRRDGEESGARTVSLSPPAMKITHTAVKLLLDDLQREQGEERRILRQILEKLPDEHAIRAIELESRPSRRLGAGPAGR